MNGEQPWHRAHNSSMYAQKTNMNADISTAPSTFPSMKYETIWTASTKPCPSFSIVRSDSEATTQNASSPNLDIRSEISSEDIAWHPWSNTCKTIKKGKYRFFLGGGSLPLSGYVLWPSALRAYAATPSVMLHSGFPILSIIYPHFNTCTLHFMPFIQKTSSLLKNETKRFT